MVLSGRIRCNSAISSLSLVALLCAVGSASIDVCERAKNAGVEWTDIIDQALVGKVDSLIEVQSTYKTPQGLTGECMLHPLLYIILSVTWRVPDEEGGREFALRLLTTARRLSSQLPPGRKTAALAMIGGRSLMRDLRDLRNGVTLLRQALSIDAAYQPARTMLRNSQARLPKELRQGRFMPARLRTTATLDQLYNRRIKVASSMTTRCPLVFGLLVTFFLQEPTDIDEHMPTLRDYASKVGIVAEMGVRTIVSTYAFLKGLNESSAHEKRLWCVDLEALDMSPEKTLAAKHGVELEFFQGDSAKTVFPGPVDLLFIDTFHVYGHLKRELEFHHQNVRRYIIMHDTTTDEWKGEVVRIGGYETTKHLQYPEEEIMRGLWPAISEFLETHPEWKIEKRFKNNNGLTIFVRVSTLQ